MSRALLFLVAALGLCACKLDAGPYTSGSTDGTTVSSGGAWQSGGSGGEGGESGTITGSGGDTAMGGQGGSGTGTSGGSGGSVASGGAGGECTPSGFGPQAQPYPVEIGGQLAWVHDDGFASGYFHTFDQLGVGGPGDIPRKVHILLPPDYEASCAHYPVVYMNDGDTAFWPGGIGNKSWSVAQGLEGLYAAGAIEEVIVVAVVPIDREAEYTHTDWAPGHACCGAAGYADYLADKVKGFVDANYRTQPEAAHTAIVGSSHGGLAAFLVAGLRPDRFGMAGCLSSSFWAGLDPIHGGAYAGSPLSTSKLLDMTKGTLSSPALRPRLWIDWGLVRTGGFHNAVIEAAATARGKEMVTLLQQSYGYVDGGSLHFLEDPEGEHDEISWSKRFPAVMKAFFGPG